VVFVWLLLLVLVLVVVGVLVLVWVGLGGGVLGVLVVGMAVLQRVAEDTAEVAKIEAHPRLEGRQMLMVIAPK
jgi:translation initiation factor IF-3